MSESNEAADAAGCFLSEHSELFCSAFLEETRKQSQILFIIGTNAWRGFYCLPHVNVLAGSLLGRKGSS